jgi:hypothetical protein
VIKRLYQKSKDYAILRKREPLFWLTIAYLAGLFYIFVVERVFWAPDTIFFLLFVLFILLGQGKRFFLAFAPFIVLLLAYDSFRGIADQLAGRVNIWPMIHFDQWIGGGTIPTTHFQNFLYTFKYHHIFDLYFFSLYLVHFIVPVMVGIYFWKRKPALYVPYVVALVALSFAGFLTYLLFPAMPPWMASDAHHIPHIVKVSSELWASAGVHNFPTIYQEIDPNPVAAVPSLHAAYPFLVTLFISRLRKNWLTAVFAFYTLSVWFGIVYMGEHYVFDVVVGASYSLIAFLGTMLVWKKHGERLAAARKKTGKKIVDWRDVAWEKIRRAISPIVRKP